VKEGLDNGYSKICKEGTAKVGKQGEGRYRWESTHFPCLKNSVLDAMEEIAVDCSTRPAQSESFVRPVGVIDWNNNVRMMKNSFAAMSVSKPTKAESTTPLDAVVDGLDAVVDGYLSYAITVNMKVGGTLGNETSIVVESSAPAVAKRAPEVPFGLLALDTGAHLNVLAYLQPNWVQWGGGGGGR
jgi:hypothetical protein